VERLVYLELERFQAEVTCQHHIYGTERGEFDGEHASWFAVPEKMVLASVVRWAKFVDRVYTADGNVEKKWAKKIELLPQPTELETRTYEDYLKSRGEAQWMYYHYIRMNRYDRWFMDGFMYGLDNCT
jgi:hypothetical protein